MKDFGGRMEIVQRPLLALEPNIAQVWSWWSPRLVGIIQHKNGYNSDDVVVAESHVTSQFAPAPVGVSGFIDRLSDTSPTLFTHQPSCCSVQRVWVCWRCVCGTCGAPTAQVELKLINHSRCLNSFKTTNRPVLHRGPLSTRQSADACNLFDNTKTKQSANAVVVTKQRSDGVAPFQLRGCVEMLELKKKIQTGCISRL